MTTSQFECWKGLSQVYCHPFFKSFYPCFVFWFAYMLLFFIYNKIHKTQVLHYWVLLFGYIYFHNDAVYVFLNNTKQETCLLSRIHDGTGTYTVCSLVRCTILWRHRVAGTRYLEAPRSGDTVARTSDAVAPLCVEVVWRGVARLEVAIKPVKTV